MIACLLGLLLALPAPPTLWKSAATGGEVRATLRSSPQATTRPTPTVVYLMNLAQPRVGQEPSERIIDDLVKSGYVVLCLDYAGHPMARSPHLNADVLKIREDIAGRDKTLLADVPVDPDRLFIIPEGFRLKRDIEFARDGERVLAMDLIYPSRPDHPVPAVMEITCDNVNRMGSGSLLFCRDTLMEGAAIAGFAAAMIDHPVRPPYKGLDDPMPEVIHRLKSAVRTLRAEGEALGLNGNIAAVGFSRGGPMAGLLAATGRRGDLEGDGPHQGISSAVQAAVVHGNRYDYLTIGPDDPMYARFEKAWGTRDANREKWATHGVIHYLTGDAAPMFLNTSDTESPEFREGLAALDRRLTELGVEHEYQLDEDGRGHRVSTDPATLGKIYRFLRRHTRHPGEQ